jgi:hypothetical protein
MKYEPRYEITKEKCPDYCGWFFEKFGACIYSSNCKNSTLGFRRPHGCYGCKEIWTEIKEEKKWNVN